MDIKKQDAIQKRLLLGVCLFMTSKKDVATAHAALYPPEPWAQSHQRKFAQKENHAHHGEHVLGFLHHTLQQDRLGIIIFQKLSHFLTQIFRAGTSESMDTHRVCELDKVWVGHTRVRVSLFVKEI